jgi:uroporphyrinogen-III synthase
MAGNIVVYVKQVTGHRKGPAFHMLPTLMITRPKGTAERLVKDLRASGGPDFTPLFAPLLDILPVTPPPFDMDPDHIIFTSAHAVAAVNRLAITRRGIAWCVGDNTAHAARLAGFTAKSASGAAANLLALIKEAAPQGRILHLHGRHTRCDFAAQLGAQCTAVCVYDQSALPLKQEARATLMGTEPVIVPLYSPRSAEIMIKDTQIGPHVRFVTMSAQIAAALVGVDEKHILVAGHPDRIGMIAVINDALSACAS